MKTKNLITAAFIYFGILNTLNAQFQYDLDSIRALVDNDKKSDLPKSIIAYIVAEGCFPGWVAYKGNKEKETPTIYPAFQISYDKNSIVVDASFSKDKFDQFKYGRKFDSKSYLALHDAFLKSELILFTHEHRDHVSGIKDFKQLGEIKEKLVFTKEQVDSKQMKEVGFAKDFFKDLKLLEYERYYKLAPGVVLIKSPGHTPGHQTVYVVLENGQEYLLIGDIVWLMKCIEQQITRPWLVSFMLKESRKKVANQVKWLNQIHQKEGERIKIIPSHDPEHLKQSVNDYFYIYKEKKL